MESNDLINSLLVLTLELKDKVEKLLGVPLSKLNKKRSLNSWSALECIEHLNLYSIFYLPEIKDKIQLNNDLKTVDVFKPGWLGNYFANAMKVDERKLKKMKTFKNKNPNGSNLDYSTIHVFLKDQYELIELLNKSKEVNLNSIKTGITISKFIKLKLGDTLKFLIYHNERHIVQALKAIENI